jgi:hypothetical protein
LQNRRNGLDRRRLKRIQQSLGICQGQFPNIPDEDGTALPAKSWPASRRNEQQVRTDGINGGGDGILSTLPDREHGNHCRYTDHDAQDGQTTAQFIPGQDGQGSQEDSFDFHRIFLST